MTSNINLDKTRVIQNSIYIYKSGLQSGPFTEEEAIELLEQMGPNDAFYWTPPMTEWHPAEEFSRSIEHVSPQKARDAHLILIVDDDPIMQELIKFQLKTVSEELETACNAEDALQTVGQLGIDQISCIVSDYMMPGATGLELVKKIKKLDKNLEVILLTARDDKEIIKEALRAGIFDFLEKPISDRELIKTVSSAIQQTLSNRKKSSDRYRIDSLIGKGGTGTVMRAWDHQLQRQVAFKRLYSNDSGILSDQALTEEALRLAKLQHPHIVNVYDCGTDSQGPYMVMELLDGITLEQHIVTVDEFPIDWLLRFTRQCLDALDYAHHKGFIHLDLKPSNIMLCRMGDAEQRRHIKVFDFGISQNLNTLGKTNNNDKMAILGSPSYMSPERFTQEQLDGRSDLYSLGCILYQLITGIEPFNAEKTQEIAKSHFMHRIKPIKKVRPNFDKTFGDWTMKLIQALPTARPSSAAKAKELLTQFYPPI
ncbi:MAG: protein kinase [Verrucomicrobiota bacterium]